MLTIKQVIITDTEREEVYRTMENVLECSYEEYKQGMQEKDLGLHRVFYKLGVLNARGDAKAKELYGKMEVTHRKRDRDFWRKICEADALKEIAKNKDRFLKTTTANLDEYDKILKKIRKILTQDGPSIVVGMAYVSQNGEMKFGGTTIIHSWITPTLYADIEANRKEVE